MRSNLPRMAEGNGWTETDPEVIERRLVAERWPNAVGRMGRPDEIAAAIAFVASEEAAFMTGAHIRINGGERPSLH
jgi:NAD(P)-dependent dehydrogenase (short-subunit alcohol dehydrogenase family)